MLVIHMLMFICLLAVNHSVLVVVLPRSNTRRLHVSVVGAHARLARRHRMSRLDTVHLHRGDLPARNMECTCALRVRAEDIRDVCFVDHQRSATAARGLGSGAA